MRSAMLFVGIVVGILLAYPAATRAETARQAFAGGNALLVKGDFRGALEAYAKAARADRANREYSQQFMLVRRVIALRASLEKENDPQRWRRTALALRSFYVDHGLHTEALAVDRKIHARLNTAPSAAQLADTQLAMNRNAEAEQVLSALTPEKATPITQALLAVALARQGKTEEARSIAGKVVPPQDAGPAALYCAARMYAVLGNGERALFLLARCFEAVPPSRLGGVKSRVKQCRDFTKLASADGFAKVLQTKSKVAESKCSGGSSCAGCPMRGKCPKSQKK